MCADLKNQVLCQYQVMLQKGRKDILPSSEALNQKEGMIYYILNPKPNINLNGRWMPFQTFVCICIFCMHYAV
jgi:hypothetical protein